jgi:hypothetical protein
MSTVYRRTAKGQAEFGQRSRELLPRLRSTLILVDGKRDLQAISTLLLQAPEVTLAALNALQAQGFVEAVGPALAPPAPVQAGLVRPLVQAPVQPVTRPAPLAPAFGRAAPAAGDFKTLQRAAVQALNQALGPAAETLAIRMERANTLDELRPLLNTASQLVGTARGPAAGADFVAKLQSLM